MNQTLWTILLLVAGFGFGVACFMALYSGEIVKYEHRIHELSTPTNCFNDSYDLKDFVKDNSTFIGQVLPDGRRIVGLAYGDYFMVWTKNRTIIDTIETCTHEYSHNNLRLDDRPENETW